VAAETATEIPVMQRLSFVVTSSRVCCRPVAGRPSGALSWYGRACGPAGGWRVVLASARGADLEPLYIAALASDEARTIIGREFVVNEGRDLGQLLRPPMST
jgi:hypothetical protein